LHKPHLRLGIKIKPPKRALLSGFYFYSELFTIKFLLKIKCLRKLYLRSFVLMLKNSKPKNKTNLISPQMSYNGIIL